MFSNVCRKECSDDIFMIFFRSFSQPHQFFDEINEMHPTIKFTMTHTTPKTLSDQEKKCPCERIDAIPFLDTLCELKEGANSTGLYRKPTDRNQY